MNLEHGTSKKPQVSPPPSDDFDFDFRPITSGLGFHHQKATEVKPSFPERTVAVSSIQHTLTAARKETPVYQNDLALFYGQPEASAVALAAEKKEVLYKLATKPQRVFAYLCDLFLVASVLGIVLTVMARMVHMDLVEVWSQYPDEITPLVVTLFCGFYLMYFSIFEKANQSTLGKNLFAIRVLSLDEKPLSLLSLLLRSSVSLLNFVSLGLFSYFDLQSRVTGSKVVRID